MSKEITTDLAAKALEYLNGIEAFVVTEAPLFVAEIYQWAIVKNSVGVGVGAFLLILGIWLLYKCKKIYFQDPDGYGFPIAMLGVWSGVILSILGLCRFFIDLLDLVKINVAPRLYLVEFFKDFV